MKKPPLHGELYAVCASDAVFVVLVCEGEHTGAVAEVESWKARGMKWGRLRNIIGALIGEARWRVRSKHAGKNTQRVDVRSLG